MITVFIIPKSPRCDTVTLLLDFFGIPYEVKLIDSPEFSENFPLHKTPAVLFDNGFKLQQTVAIVEYIVSIADEQKAAGLMGSSLQEYVSVLKWFSLVNQDVVEAMTYVVLPILGKIPMNKAKYDSGVKFSNAVADILEKRLSEYTYLVGERISMADVNAAITYALFLRTVYDLEWVSRHPGIYRWFKTVKEHPMIKAYLEDHQIIAKKLEYKQPQGAKKSAGAGANGAAAKPAASAKPAPEAAPVEEKKPKHPLEALGKPAMVLDEWKRVYSNEETREAALPWFWDHFDAQEWSLYKVGYKYNEELTLTFMSNNLVGGFFNRLSASTKYMFGCLVVYGENNDNGIVGAFLVRGQDFEPAFDVAPDWESYEYAKLDPTSESDREFVDNMWAWDRPVVVDGKPREIADGKVLK